MKKCIKCDQPKEQDGFYHTSSKKCKECVKGEVRQNRLLRLEYYREYDRKRSVLPHRVEQRKKVNTQWQRDGRRLEVVRRYREKYPEKYKAITMVSNALRSGKLLQPDSCEKCGKATRNIEGHHDDYSKPLEVRWLCLTCHAETRRIYKREEDGNCEKRD